MRSYGGRIEILPRKFKLRHSILCLAFHVLGPSLFDRHSLLAHVYFIM